MLLAALLALLDEIASEHAADVVGLEDDAIDARYQRALAGLTAFAEYAATEGGAVIGDELREKGKVVRAIHDGALIETQARFDILNDIESIIDGVTPAPAEDEPVIETTATDVTPDTDPIEVDAAEIDVTDPELITASRRPAPTFSRPRQAAIVDAAPDNVQVPETAPATFLTASGGELVTHESMSPVLDIPTNTTQTEASSFNIAEAFALTAARAQERARFTSEPVTYNSAWFPGSGYAGVIGKVDSDSVTELLDNAAAGLQASSAGDYLDAAAGCEPAEHSYNFAGTNVSATMPIWDSRIRWTSLRSRWNIRLRQSLMSFEPSDSADTTVTSGHVAGDPVGAGKWTLANDADSNAAKVACAVPTCTNEQQFELAAFYRCVNLTNLEVMTDPEKVEQFLRLGATAWVRALERDLIDEMLTLPGAMYIQQSAGQYGANSSVAREILPVIREQVSELEHQEGWSSTGYELITMSWVKDLIRNELHRRPGYSSKGEGYSDAYIKGEMDINLIFSDVGSSGRRTGWKWEEVPRLATTGAYTASPRNITFGPHRRFPNDMPYILAPRGTIQAVDRGAIQMGVQQWTDGFGSVIRDSTTAASNQFSVWWEIAKAVMSTGNPFIVGIITDLQDTGAEVAPVAPTAYSSLTTATRTGLTAATGITFVQV